MKQVTYHIKRHQNGRSYMQSFTFEYQKDRTILWGLQRIKETMDPTLTFIAACRSAVCGACSVRINGQAMLGCETKIAEIVERYGKDEITIEPLGNFDVIRDLAVDWEAKVTRLKALAPWFYPKAEYSREKGTRQSVADFKKFIQNAECILCGCCASECNKLTANREDFIEPYAFAKGAKFVRDSRDNDEAKRVRAAGNKGLWKCVHCMNCISRCPKKLEPAKDISRMRRIAAQMGDVEGPVKGKGFRHAEAFKQDLLKTGRLNEVTMSLKTDGLVDSAKQAGYATRLFLHGKINPFDLIIPHKAVEGIEGVRRIAKKVEEAQK